MSKEVASAGGLRSVSLRSGRSARRVTGLVGVVILSVASMNTAAAAGRSRSTAKADVSYYDGKTITFDVAGAPGSGAYLLGQDLAPFMGSFLHATVNVVPVPAATGAVEQDDVASAAPNGLTIGELDTNDDVAADIIKVPNINFGMLTVPTAGAVPPSLYVLAATPSSGITSFAQLLHRKSPVTALGFTGDITLSLTTYLRAFGIPAKILTGYASSSEEVAGFLRGDGELMLTAENNMTTELKSKEAVPILLSQKVYPTAQNYSLLKNVPTASQFAAKHKAKSGAGRKALSVMNFINSTSTVNRAIFAPKGTPEKYMLALSAAFKAAISNAHVRQLFVTQAFLPIWIDPKTVTSELKREVRDEKLIRTYVNS